MAYMVVETSVRTHRKFLAAGPEASWLWLCGLGYCKEGLTDGFIPDTAIDFLGVKRPRRLARRLVSVHLWEAKPGGWQMHDYLKHNKPAEQVRATMRKRAEGGKLGGRPPKTLKDNLEGSQITFPETHVQHNTVQHTTVQQTHKGCVFIGSRLRVSQRQLDAVVSEMGSEAGYVDWMALFPKWDTELLESGAKFNTLNFLRERAERAVKAFRAGGPLYAEPEGEDWFDECKRLHNGQCNGRVGHADQVAIDAARAEKASA